MINQAIVQFDRALRTVFAPAHPLRPTPGDDLPEVALGEAQKRHAAALMRVNHSGEICAQALYQGQALTARDPSIRVALERASREETDHLAWTAQRIDELGGRKSILNPLWYGGALAIGVFASSFGDRWNLGFLAETERQVEVHLNGHLEALSADDPKSRAIVSQMRQDEANHAETAVRLGAHELPASIRLAMKFAAKIMTGVAYRL
ncbi:MAG: 2-polyprenyl-3-methyl-6-methoxy-1,4-benzoquinone monooxygenase [Azoarcus sp.]|jgi:ubiquinone biosynthesis monooxygenase Coq7|nr:2-polyprenyl-3-methyl-6-methoxy-1,4-benzoquinone monooxygenase [Azoarcus sp.]